MFVGRKEDQSNVSAHLETVTRAGNLGAAIKKRTLTEFKHKYTDKDEYKISLLPL